MSYCSTASFAWTAQLASSPASQTQMAEKLPDLVARLSVIYMEFKQTPAALIAVLIMR